MHNYRMRPVAHDRAQEMFVTLVRALARMDGLNFRKQRLDSTHIISNIALLTRLGLFVETVTHFLRQLRKIDTEQDGRPVAQVQLKTPGQVGSSSLQSPYDPDVSHGHKGKGYEAQLSETCSEDNPYQVITYVELNGAHESDQRAVIPALDVLDRTGLKPTTLYADRGYGSGANIVEAGKRGVDLQVPVQDPSRKRTSPPGLDEPVEGADPLAGSSEKATTKSPGNADETCTPEELKLGDFAYSLDYQVIRACPAGRSPPVPWDNA